MTGHSLATFGDCVAILSENEIMSYFEIDDAISHQRLLSTDYFLLNCPEKFPWAPQPTASARERLTYWDKVLAVQRDPFQSLSLAIFGCWSKG